MATIHDMLADPLNPEGRLCQFTRTKMCKFHMSKKCTKGDQCPFAHVRSQLRNLPDLRYTKICKTLIETGQCKDKACLYAHNKEQLRSTGAFHKTKLCRFMQTGYCSLGPKCNFAHAQSELRLPAKIEGFVLPPGLELQSFLGLLEDDENDDDEDIAIGPGEHANTGVNFKSSPEDLDALAAMESWNRGSEDIATGLGEHANIGVNFKSSPGDMDVLAAMDSWNRRSKDIATGSDEHANTGVNFKSSPGDMDVLAAMESWSRGSVDLGIDSYWSYDFNSHVGGMHLYPNEGCSNFDLNTTTFPDWSGDWFGAGLHDYTNQFGGDYAGGDWQLFRDNVVIDQQEEWKASKSRSANEIPKMRSVRTSESTLCTLSDFIS
jgi:hypothetical protein